MPNKKIFGLLPQTARELKHLREREKNRAHQGAILSPISQNRNVVIFTGKTTATHASGATQAVTRNKVDDTAGSITDQVKNPFTANIAANRYVFYTWVNGGFKIFAADC